MAILHTVTPILARLRQWSYPPEFRISFNTEDLWVDTLSIALSQALNEVKSLKSPIEKDAQEVGTEDVKPEEASSAEEDDSRKGDPDVDVTNNSPVEIIEQVNLINRKFLISLCDDHYHMRRNVKLLMKEGNSSRELRSMERSVRKVDELLEDNGVLCLDLTDEFYDPGRNDFEPLCEAEEDPSLTESKILRCECPAIWLKGKLIRPASGIVARPA